MPESLIDCVLSVSGTDYHDIGASGRRKSSKNISQSLTPRKPLDSWQCGGSEWKKLELCRVENDEIL